MGIWGWLLRVPSQGYQHFPHDIEIGSESHKHLIPNDAVVLMYICSNWYIHIHIYKYIIYMYIDIHHTFTMFEGCKVSQWPRPRSQLGVYELHQQAVVQCFKSIKNDQTWVVSFLFPGFVLELHTCGSGELVLPMQGCFCVNLKLSRVSSYMIIYEDQEKIIRQRWQMPQILPDSGVMVSACIKAYQI